MRWLQYYRARLSQDPRLLRILHGGASGILGKGLSILISAVTLPLTLRYLGKLEYGVWITISTSVVMFSVLDLGIANTLTNFISDAYSSDDKEKAQQYFATAFWLTIIVSFVLAAVAVLALRLVDWGSVLNLTDPVLISHSRICLAIAVVFFLLGLPLNLANRVLSGYQQVHIANYFAMINSLMGLVAIVSVVVAHGTIVHLMLAYCIAMLTGSVMLNVWIGAWFKPWIRPHPGKVKAGMARQMFGQGALFFVLQLTGLVVFNSDNLVITHYLGAAEVTPYSIAWRLTSYASLLQSLFVPAMWPAFSEAYFRGDLPWIRKTYRQIMRATLLTVGSAALVLGVGGRLIIRVWAGHTAVPGAALLWSMCLWSVLLSITVNQAALMAATQRLQLQTVAAVCAASANIALSIVLVQRMGAIGVILATISSYVVFIIFPQTWEIGRILRGRYMKPVAIPDEALGDGA